MVKGEVHPSARLDQLRRDDALGHAALLLLGLLRRLRDYLRRLLGLSGGGGDDGEELLNGETLERLGDALDARHACLDGLDAWWYFDSTSFPWLLSKVPPPFNFFSDLIIFVRRVGEGG